MSEQLASRAVTLTRLTTHLGRGLRRVATDAALRGARAFPRRIQDLDAATLSRIMGRTVSPVEIIGDTSGTTTRARLALRGDGVPDSAFVKMTALTTATRLIGELGRLGETEIRFYRQLSPQLDTGVPTHPMRDVAYTLVTSMTTGDRQDCQRELLDIYRRALAACGGPDLEHEHLWLRYRQAAAYTYVAATITAGLGGMQTEDIALAGLRLAVAALADLETAAALRKVL